MIHVTEMAIDGLRGRLDATSRGGRLACTGQVATGTNNIAARWTGSQSRLPTCPRCAVLWDEALSARVTP